MPIVDRGTPIARVRHRYICPVPQAPSIFRPHWRPSHVRNSVTLLSYLYIYTVHCRSHPVLSPDFRFYYLTNFERALAWIAERYGDLLAPPEEAFLREFATLPLASRALLVRMLMRKGRLFRSSKLAYEEIGDALAAATPLLVLGWLNAEPELAIDELFALLTKAELKRIFAATSGGANVTKTALLDALRPSYTNARRFEAWLDITYGVADGVPHAVVGGVKTGAARDTPVRPCGLFDPEPLIPERAERIFDVTIAPLCERLRLMFFGNLRQTWAEFVLAELGIFQYERVAFDTSSRAFQQRADIDRYMLLQQCRDTLDAEFDLEPLLATIETVASDNPWIERRRAKLLFHIGQHCERGQDWQNALSVYQQCRYPGARHRRLRVLERSECYEQAWPIAREALAAPESDEERQRVARMIPRLRRRLGATQSLSPLPSLLQSATNAAANCIDRIEVVLPRPATPTRVELIARDHLARDDAPVHYVENALFNSLFGLLCWEAIFEAVPGAFFHPFQSGPADLYAHDFYTRRATSFDACLEHLASTRYRETILRCFAQKRGIQSPFVSWGLLTEELLAQALDCLPAAHLRACFGRLLRDLKANRSGLPDLIQFWPAAQHYALIEVKGPGDRLQDNQLRWLDFCATHSIPVKVLHLRWAHEAHESGVS